MKRILFFVSLALCVTGLFAGIATAQTTFFEDDFSGTALDASKWVSFENAGTISVENGVVKLRRGSGKFPYVHASADPFPPGNFRLTVRMRFTSSGGLGTGLHLARFLPANGIGHCSAEPTAEFGLPIAGIMGGDGRVHVAHIDRPFRQWMTNNGSEPIVAGPAPEIEFRTYVFTFIDGIVDIAIDGETVGTATTVAPRPEMIWFGEPINCSGPWSELEIDFIEVAGFELADTDDDGTPDISDNCPLTPNPSQDDADEDSAGDACDNCPLPNSDQRDDDGNGIGDVCDQLAEFLGIDDLEDRLDSMEDHTHTYRTGGGVGHNNTEAETGEADVQAD
jgi:hypothetical protein